MDGLTKFNQVHIATDAFCTYYKPITARYFPALYFDWLIFKYGTEVATTMKSLQIFRSSVIKYKLLQAFIIPMTEWIWRRKSKKKLFFTFKVLFSHCQVDLQAYFCSTTHSRIWLWLFILYRLFCCCSMQIKKWVMIPTKKCLRLAIKKLFWLVNLGFIMSWRGNANVNHNQSKPMVVGQGQ